MPDAVPNPQFHGDDDAAGAVHPYVANRFRRWQHTQPCSAVNGLSLHPARIGWLGQPLSPCKRRSKSGALGGEIGGGKVERLARSAAIGDDGWTPSLPRPEIPGVHRQGAMDRDSSPRPHRRDQQTRSLSPLSDPLGDSAENPHPRRPAITRRASNRCDGSGNNCGNSSPNRVAIGAGLPRHTRA
jgi:hypothetical protein